jgi:hypothetical protein
MSDSPNRAVDFGAGVIVGILLAVGIGGAYMFTQVRAQHMRAAEEAERAMYAERVAHMEAEEATHKALQAELLAREAEQRRLGKPAATDQPTEAPEMPPTKDPE